MPCASVASSFPAPADGAQGGFTYLALMILVAILALATSATLTLGSIAQRRDAERRLLEVGDTYRRAIASYVNSSPGGNRSYPASLDDLLRDPRYPGVRRHLRQLYPDPITGKSEWGLIPAPGGGIMGVRSLSEAKPIKIAEFEAENESFEGKSRYADWAFVVQAALAGSAARPGSGPGAYPPGALAAPNAPLPPGAALPGLFPPTNPGLNSGGQAVLPGNSPLVPQR